MPINSFADYYLSWKPERSMLTRPFYLSLAQMLEEDIKNGTLPGGTKLPPQRELADYLDLNFTTITRAYKVCENKNLIYGISGSGTFVRSSAFKPVLNSRESYREGIELGFIASFEECNQMILPVVQRVGRKSYLEKLLSYDSPTGFSHQKQAGLNWMAGFGIQAAEDQVAIATGTMNGISLCLLAFFDPGDKIAVEEYTYSNLIDLAKLLHLNLIPIPTDEKGMIPGQLAEQCSKSELKGVFLMPSCCNPTTVFMPQERKEQLAEVIRHFHLLLMEDDIYAFATAGQVPGYEKPMRQLIPEQTVYICGTSKSICSGLRVSYLVFAEHHRDDLQRAMFNTNVKTSSLDAEVITELIKCGKAQEIAAKKIQMAEEANRIFAQVFPHQNRRGFSHPNSFFRWLPLEHMSVRQGETRLMERGVRVYGSDRFAAGSGQKQQALRVSLATASLPHELRKGLEIIKEECFD